MTRQTTTGTSGTAADIGYEYSSTQNNGRILSRTNYQRGIVDGEKVSYQYDDLNRLVTATSTTKDSGGATIKKWGQDFAYDGFGNLLSQTPKSTYPDVSPNVSWTVSGTNNRISTGNWTYDSNGNTTQMPVLGGGTAGMTFDVDNRMVTWTGPASSTPEMYGYLSDNKRVWKKTPAGVETFYLYGLGGQKLMTCSVNTSPFSLVCSMTNVYFGGKAVRVDGDPVVHDRLGSVVARGGYGAGTVGKREYFPYGDEVGTVSSGNADKFGTYHRDATTGLDYADQRYFAGTLSGRFLTADPYEASGGASNPGSWGRYAYVGGDPVNFRDPSGLLMAPPGPDIWDGPGGGGGGGSAWGWLSFFFPGGGGSIPPTGASSSNGLIGVDEGWKRDPGSRVAAWDLLIAGAIAANETRSDESDVTDLRYPHHLQVTEDCYVRGGYGGAAYRRRTYELRDQQNELIPANVRVQEFNYVVRGELKAGNTVWNSGRVVDNISIGSGKVTTQYQQFTAQITGGLFAMPAPVPIMVREMDGRDYGTLGVHMEKDVIFINGNDGKVNGELRWCR